jgi:hypothetical protein
MDGNLLASTPANGHQQFGQIKMTEYLVTQGLQFF